MVKQLLAGAGQLAQLDDGVIGGLPTAQTLGVGAQRRGEHPRVATVILGAGDREAVPETVELLGVDRIDGEASLQEALDHGSVRHLDGNADLARRGVARALDCASFVSACVTLYWSARRVACPYLHWCSLALTSHWASNAAKQPGHESQSGARSTVRRWLFPAACRHLMNSGEAKPTRPHGCGICRFPTATAATTTTVFT